MNFRRASRAWTRRNGALHAFAYIVLLAGPARAGHAPLVPEPRTILIREGRSDHVVVGTRRGGYFITKDAGHSWSWMCEAGVGYEDEEVYPGVFLGSGALVLSTGFGGAAVSRDGCGWSQWLPSASPFIADVRVRQDAPDVVLALEARADGEGFVNQLWQTSDDAESWQQLGEPFAADTQAISLAVSNGGDIYVSAAGKLGAELLHTDGAGDWTRTIITPEQGVVPRLIGAHAATSRHLYLVLDHAQVEGVDAPGDRALVSVDGGETFTALLEAVGDLSAWSLSHDGERLAVGGHSDGIHLLDDARHAGAGATLEQVSSKAVHALAWDAAGTLYAAGHEAADGYSVGISQDGGRTFSPLFALCQVDGPLSCPADTSVGALCLSSGETGWDVRKEVADSKACTADGAAGAGAPSSNSAADPELTPHDHEDSPEPAEQQASNAGSCSAAAGRRSANYGAMAALAALAVALRRWKARPRGEVPRLRRF